MILIEEDDEDDKDYKRGFNMWFGETDYNNYFTPGKK